MGRPKGSKNKAKSEATVTGTFTLTDEELAPIRAQKAAHDRAVEKFVAEETRKERQMIDRGEAEELSVVQVTAFDLSGAFKNAAMKKAMSKGFNVVSNLRKLNGNWVFEASYDEKATQL